MYNRITLGFQILLLVGLACRAPLRFTAPLPADTSFETVPANSERAQAYQAAAGYSEKTGGLSLVILRAGKIEFEVYHNGADAATPAHMFSGTKTFAGLLALAAVADGKLDLEERVADTLVEFAQDKCKREIRVRHLLRFTSGMDQSFLRLSRDGMVPPEKQRVKDKYAHAMGLDCKTTPGARYEYGSSHLMIFGAFIKRKLGEDPLAYLQRRVFEPIGFRHAGWYRDPAGNPMLPYGAWTTAREWSKVGLLLLGRGEFKGKRVLPETGFEELTRGSTAMPAYGLTVWLNREVPADKRAHLIRNLRKNAIKGRAIDPGGPPDLYAAAGFNGNRLYIIPSRDLIIARMGTSESFQDAEFLRLLR